MSEFLHKSIFISGIHRSGTSWVGNMLKVGANHHNVFDEEIFHINRPGNPMHVMYEYICKENETNYINWFNEVVFSNSRYSFKLKIKKAKSVRNIAGVVKRKLHSSIINIFYKRKPTIFIEPMGLLSAEWFSKNYGTKMIIIIRHPASFISSIKMWGDGHDHSNFPLFLNQSLLIKDLLSNFKGDMEDSLSNGDDTIGRNIIFWKMIYSVVKYYEGKYPNWIFIRHEDLAKNPIKGFKSLYEKLDIDFQKSHEQIISAHCSSTNPVEAPINHPGLIRRDSKATIKNWRHRLSIEEIDRIRNSVWDVSKNWYSEEDW